MSARPRRRLLATGLAGTLGGGAAAGVALVVHRNRIAGASRILSTVDRERARRRRAEDLATAAVDELDDLRARLSTLEAEAVRLRQREQLRGFIRETVPAGASVVVVGAGTGDLLGLRDHDLLWLEAADERATDAVLVDRLAQAHATGVRFAVTLATAGEWFRRHEGVDRYLRANLLLRAVDADGGALYEFDSTEVASPVPDDGGDA